MKTHVMHSNCKPTTCTLIILLIVCQQIFPRLLAKQNIIGGFVCQKYRIFKPNSQNLQADIQSIRTTRVSGEYQSVPPGAFLGPLDSLPAHIEGDQALAEASRGDNQTIIPRSNQSSSSSLVIESGTEPYCHSSGKGQEVA